MHILNTVLPWAGVLMAMVMVPPLQLHMLVLVQAVTEEASDKSTLSIHLQLGAHSTHHCLPPSVVGRAVSGKEAAPCSLDRLVLLFDSAQPPDMAAALDTDMELAENDVYLRVSSFYQSLGRF